MRVLAYLGPILVLAILVSGVVVVFATLRGPGLDQESHAFVDCAIPAITSNWEQDALMKRASSRFLNERAADIEGKFEIYRRLGRLRSYEGSRGDSSAALGLGGLDITGKYYGSARFDTGEADLQVDLVKRGGDWLIDDFKVESKAISAADAERLPASVNAEGADTDVNVYGTGVDGFERWAKAGFSAWAFRYQSASEVWIAMSDSYGPFPSESLAARAGAKYLSFVNDTDKIRVVLFRTNEKGAEATVTRSTP